ncbi:hypothetical protein H7U19_06655 [Hyunsoonleella sp. SJ7]|uniref:Uncharacterized protein n=1 Tax=Hyunsoonleella aquatilis TaxID=2762758 RepID=A0A923KKQ5_9FLAO|nr:hypothetical protein [Hyunsoonleella aquatilis]MBC3758078.1 hypothetical protein [Hyunsoonleella aquatilis]
MTTYITLGIILLLFLAMYAYAYGSVYLESLRKERSLKQLEERQEANRRLKMSKQRQREEKLQKIRQRSREIKERIKEVERERALVAQKFKNTVKVELIKSTLQQDSTQQQAG